MSELRRYYLSKEVLKERSAELIDFAYDQEPTRIELVLRASVDEVATFRLSLDGNITREGKLNE